MSINLPDLKPYKNKILNKGIKLLLQPVACATNGLLHVLPTPPKEKTGWPVTEETVTSLYNKNTN